MTIKKKKLNATLSLPDHPLHGAKVRLVRQSLVTGRWRVRLLADHGGAGQLGDELMVHASEFVIDGITH
jgi:hypothetical protein